MKAIKRARGVAGRVQRLGPDAIEAADRSQRRWPVFGFPLAVLAKFNDDQAGNLAALIAYFGFVSIFPLFLLLSAVLDVVLRNDPHLQQSLLNSALAQYPVIGPQIHAQTTKSIPGSGLPFVFGGIFLLLGSLGVARAMQNAICGIWGIPRNDRPPFPWSYLWSLALIVAVGAGFIVTTSLSGLAGGVGHGSFIGAGAHVAAIAISLVLNVGMFWLSFWLAAMRRVRWRDLRIGAVIAGAAWTLLQLAGGYVIAHQLARANELYGSFGLVLGLIAWLYLQAEITLYAAEVDVVVAKRLWPVPLPGADEKAAAPVVEAGAGPAAAAAEPVRAPEADVPEARPGVPGPRPAREDRAGSKAHGNGKAGTGE
jgi:membrane protein